MYKFIYCVFFAVAGMDGFSKRFSGAADEPLAMRGPLMGLFKTMPVPASLDDSLDMLKGDAVSHGIDPEELAANMEMASIAAENRVADGDTSMPAHYQAAITLYTAQFYNGESLYAVLNKLMRDADRSKIKRVAKYVWLLMHALELCPPYKGALVFRGVKGLLSGYVPGLNCCWVQFSSTASSVEVQNEFLGKEGQRTLFSIELTTGRAREISQYSFYPQEREVLLPANTMLFVVAVMDMGHELSNVQLREVTPLDPIHVFKKWGELPAPPSPLPPAPPSPGPIPAPPVPGPG